MGALETLAVQLLGEQAQEQIRAENPYFQFMAPAQAFSQGAMSAQTTGQNPRAEMWNKAIAASLGGLLGGGLQGLGTDYQNTLTDRYQKALGQSLMGQEPSAEGLAPGLFGAAKRAGTLFKAVRGAGKLEQADTADATVALQDRLIDVARRQRIAEIEAEDEAYRNTAGSGVAPKAGLVVLGKGAAAPAVVADSLVLPEGNPNNPYYKDALDKTTRLQDQGEKIRKEFNALDEVKNFPAVERSARVLAKAVKDQSAMSDQELVRYAILMIEPGMAVREGEQAAVAASQSIPDAWKGGALKALNGEAALGADARAGILRLAGRAYESQKAQYDRALTFYQNRAQEVGLNPQALSRIGEALPVDEIMGKGPPAVPEGFKLQQNKRTGEFRVVPK